MKRSWVNFCLYCLEQRNYFYVAGNRKILRSFTYTFNSFELDLTLKDIGYSKQKLSLLKSLYYHQEAVASASKIWSYLLKRRNYSSACFHTYNHFVKKGARSPQEKTDTRSPCLQSVILTLREEQEPYQRKELATHVDVFYRTTEIFKKFPADLLFLHWVLYEHFDLSTAPIKSVTFHFANATVHPMYLTTLLVHLDNPLTFLKSVAKESNAFSKQVFKWLIRYIRNEEPINKFKQAKSIKDHLVKSLSDPKLEKIYNYSRKVIE